MQLRHHDGHLLAHDGVQEFKATPGSGHVFAATLAAGKAHPLAAPFTIDRFISGKLIDEHGAAGVAH